MEGGRPLDMSVQKLDINGFTTKQKFDEENQNGSHLFTPPCLLISSMDIDGKDQSQNSGLLHKTRYLLVFFCVPVSPGYSRMILSAPRNIRLPTDFFTPPWISHLIVNLIIDSDLNLLHVEEKNFMEIGPSNWLKSCFVPTQADTNVISFRRWLHKYSSASGQVDWSAKFSNDQLPPTPTREKLLDRYWSHTVNCKSCSSAYKGFTILEFILQVSSICLIGVAAASNQSMVKSSAILMAILCFVASKWLSGFIHKTFRYHDYDHAFVGSPTSSLMKIFFSHNGLT
ncbi:oxygenase [Lithospermum erythrorhizon]|uniref:Oxygenase n=1 Tax=Lithospermum erythrorhizon TaxID=34254 RepID=A0AAV3R8Y8_LITER